MVYSISRCILLYLTVIFVPHQDFAVSEEEIHVCVGIAKWREAVENASTVSRLHVLLGIMDASIKWEKSAENAVSRESVITYFMASRATINCYPEVWGGTKGDFCPRPKVEDSNFSHLPIPRDN